MRKITFVVVSLLVFLATSWEVQAQQARTLSPSNSSGIFTNTGATEYLQSLLNGCVPATEGQTPLVDAVTGCVATPAGATVHQIDAVAGYANTSANSSGRTVANTTGGYFSCRAIANGSGCWGVNPLVVDTAGEAGANLIGEEVDINVFGAPSFVNGISLLLDGTGTMPAGTQAISVQDLIGTAEWDTGILLGNEHAATSSTTKFFPKMQFGNMIWNGSSSAPDFLNFAAAGGTGANPYIDYVWSHPSGTAGPVSWGPQSPVQFALFTTTGAGVRFRPDDINATTTSTITVPTQANGTMAILGKNGISSGSITMSRGTGSHTFTASYTAVPVCTATDTTSAAAVKITGSMMSVTVTGTGADMIDWICVPATN